MQESQSTIALRREIWSKTHPTHTLEVTYCRRLIHTPRVPTGTKEQPSMNTRKLRWSQSKQQQTPSPSHKTESHPQKYLKFLEQMHITWSLWFRPWGTISILATNRCPAWFFARKKKSCMIVLCIASWKNH
jgi:hypothetical protein